MVFRNHNKENMSSVFKYACRELKEQRREQERPKSNRSISETERNNDFAGASHFLIHFFADFARL